MRLFTKEIIEKLVAIGHQQDAVRGTNVEIDFVPVVKLFTPDANCTWLLTEIDSDYPELAFGLCDLGMQCPELGSVSIPELESARGKLGLPVERDRHFKATHRLTDSFFRNAVEPFARATCNWKTRFARSMPMIGTSDKDASSVRGALANHHRCHQVGHPPHQKSSYLKSTQSVQWALTPHTLR